MELIFCLENIWRIFLAGKNVGYVYYLEANFKLNRKKCALQQEICMSDKNP